ncbi:MAG: tetratricopeptide repeat protein [Deltaproteobacteria bacterium]|nr:tetratricopeptide repeat protein [Deltaproteobacteria bacterium]
MKGSCPGCKRVYDISDEFLSMGGKAKCPHCLLELLFTEAPRSPATTRPSPGPGDVAKRKLDPRRDPTRTDRRRPYVPRPDLDELDARCSECGRHFKIDRQYLVMGGQARCPHCAVELEVEGLEELRAQRARRAAPQEEPWEEDWEGEGAISEEAEPAPSGEDLVPTGPGAGDEWRENTGSTAEIDPYRPTHPGMEAGPAHPDEVLAFDGQDVDDRAETDVMQSPYASGEQGQEGLDAEEPFDFGSGEKNMPWGAEGLPDLTSMDEGEEEEEEEGADETMEISQALLAASMGLEEGNEADSAEQEASEEPDAEPDGEGRGELGTLDTEPEGADIGDLEAGTAGEGGEDVGGEVEEPAEPARSPGIWDEETRQAADFADLLARASEIDSQRRPSGEGEEQQQEQEQEEQAPLPQPGEDTYALDGDEEQIGAEALPPPASEERAPLPEPGEDTQAIDDPGFAPGAVDSDAAQAASAPAGGGLMTDLASDKDWATAAAKWAEGGFKAEDMPSFIKSTPPTISAPPPAAAVEASVVVSDEALVEAPAPIAEIGGAEVEVSDADIMELDADEVQELGPLPVGPAVVPAPAATSWAKRISEEIARRREDAAKPGAPEQRIQLPAFLAWMAHPLVLAGTLGVMALIVIGLLWAFLGSGEEVSAFVFPKVDGEARLIADAPAPAEYKAREEAVVHYGLGNRHAYMGRFEDAVSEYQRASQIDHGFPQPHRALGSVYAAMGKMALAAHAYEAYLRLAPDGPDTPKLREILAVYRGEKSP